MAPTAKFTAARLRLRKTAAGATPMLRAIPAWIAAESSGVVLPFMVVPRVRAELFLRSVTLKNVKRLRSSSDVRGGR